MKAPDDPHVRSCRKDVPRQRQLLAHRNDVALFKRPVGWGTIVDRSFDHACLNEAEHLWDWPGFPYERKKVAWNCLLHNIIELLKKDILENQPGCMWESQLTSELSNLSDMRNLDALNGYSAVRTILHEIVVSSDGDSRIYRPNEFVREHFANIRYRDYFQDPNENTITWVASKPRSITIEWVGPDDELSIYVEIRNPSLQSLVLLAVRVYFTNVGDNRRITNSENIE